MIQHKRRFSRISHILRLILLTIILIPLVFAPSTSSQAANSWAIGNIVGLCKGTQIRHGSGFQYAVHTIVPEDNWAVKVIDGPRFANGQTWWGTSRKAAGDPSGGTGWVYQSQADSCFNQPPPPPPDSDGDGIPNNSDQCPNQHGQGNPNGCPPSPPADSDGDGIPDSNDQCPNQHGQGNSNGCPPICAWPVGLVVVPGLPKEFPPLTFIKADTWLWKLEEIFKLKLEGSMCPNTFFAVGNNGDDTVVRGKFWNTQ